MNEKEKIKIRKSTITRRAFIKLNAKAVSCYFSSWFSQGFFEHFSVFLRYSY
jgi:hypothetical protein